jgi:GT2 family glycosyltransferase
MATAVLDLDISHLSPVLENLDKYQQAFILFRYKGSPVGTLTLPVTDGRIRIDEHSDAVIHATMKYMWKRRVHEALNYQEQIPVSKLPSATIAICTRNRTDDLRRCLDALMKLPDDGQEILVIDNAPSNDDTHNLVEGYAKVRYVREPRPGLNIARNRALKEASNEIVAFTDDDAVPDQHWLRALLKNYTRERVVCVTGMTMPLELETEGQLAFERYNPFNKGFDRKLYDSLHDPLSTGQVGAGANMSFRRSVIQLVGEFDEALDAGTVTQSGGDHEYFTRILRAGYYIVYEPDALNWHRHRRTMEDTRKAIYGYGVGVYAYWTKLFWYDKEFPVIRFTWGWFWHDQLRKLYKALRRRPGHQPLSLILAELKGCWAGPWAYFRARRNVQSIGKKGDAVAVNDVQQNISSKAAAEKLKTERTVSIITPTHNRRRSLERLLLSIAGQDHPMERIEMVVVCDGCTDDTVSFLKEYSAPFSLKFIEQPGLGAANARNQGAALASGEQLIFLDDDIEASPGLVSAFVRACNREEDVVVGYLPMELRKNAPFYEIMLTRWWEEKYHLMSMPGYRYNFEDLLSGNFSLRAGMFRKVGGFNASFKCREDYELGYRLITAGAVISFCRDAWGYHRDEVTNEIRSHKRKRLEGYWDVQFAKIHPGIIPALRLAEMKDPARKKKLKMFLAFHLPFITDAIAELGVLFMRILESMKMRNWWMGMEKKLHAYWYMRGVGDHVKTIDELAKVFEKLNERNEIEHEIDISNGIELAGSVLESLQTRSVRVLNQNMPVATIRARPGDMNLGAHDLRALLATRYAWDFYESMLLNGQQMNKNERV